MRKWIVAVIACALVNLVPVSAQTAKSAAKSVDGTISSIDGTNLMVKTADGKETMVMMDAKTKITRGKTKLEVKALKVGDHVVAAGADVQSMIQAETVDVGAPAPAKAGAKK